VSETKSDLMRARFARLGPSQALVSDWVTAELSSALAIKIRTRALMPSDRMRALETYRKLVSESLVVLPIDSSHFRSAARLADRQDLALRAGDALHLAIAMAHGATLLTLDRRLHEACLALGHPVETV
jgi:predicted nucleic acid-binding protein